MPGYGNVIGTACSDWGIVRALAATQPTNTVQGMKFGASASFSDFVVPVIPGSSGVMPATVRVAFGVNGSTSGYTLATGNFAVSSSLGGAGTNYSSLPSEDLQTLSIPIQIGLGNGFFLSAGIQLTAGNCSTPLQGGNADYYSGNNGIRILQIGFFNTNGEPLPNVQAMGSNSGISYRVGPELSITLTNGLTQILISGFPGSKYVTEAATNLSVLPAATAWTPVSTNTSGASGRIQFIAGDTLSLPQRYFRARLQ
jgi:hypothetical protein